MSTAILIGADGQTSSRWLINKRQDLIWFIGSALTGYIALAIMVGARSYGAALGVLWWSFINNPHIFGTATRTYFDKDERRRLSRLLWMIIPLSVIPFLLAEAGFIKPLFVFALLWGNWHVAKQHFGIAMLYKRKTGERGDVEIDKWFILVSQTLPSVLFVAWYLSVPVWGTGIFEGVLIVQLVIAAVYVRRQFLKYRNAHEINLAKLGLFASVVPLHWLAFVIATNDPVNGIFIFSIATNFGHALQYHRLTWFHNKNRYTGKPGASGFLSRSALYYYAAGFGLYLIFVTGALLSPSTVSAELILTGPTFMHYLLDTKIWRVRGNQELAQALNLA